MRGGGLRQIKHLPQSSFTGQFFQITTFGIAFYQSNHSMLVSLYVEGQMLCLYQLAEGCEVMSITTTACSSFSHVPQSGKMNVYLEPHGAGEVRVVLQPHLCLSSSYRLSGQRYTPISTHLCKKTFKSDLSKSACFFFLSYFEQDCNRLPFTMVSGRCLDLNQIIHRAAVSSGALTT